jgi:hypothetical protein
MIIDASNCNNIVRIARSFKGMFHIVFHIGDIYRERRAKTHSPGGSEDSGRDGWALYLFGLVRTAIL